MRTVTAFYDSMTEAQAAAARIAELGVDRDAVRIVDQSEAGTTGTTDTSTDQNTGFFAGLRDLFMPDEDRHAYAEGIRRGGALLTAQVDEDQIDQVVSLLDETGAVDIDERASSWRSEGWHGYEGSSTEAGMTGGATTAAGGYAAGSAARTGSVEDAGYAAGSSARTRDVEDKDYAASERATATTGALGATGRTELGTSAGGTNLGTDLGRDETHIPIIEEQLRVGKREVGRGTVRVRSYVVETPIEQDVTLREERVTIERRPTDRAADTVGADSFQERSFELTETAEEAVVEKTARVKEEVILRKDLDERTQTIADTVRRTEVEVEDTRTSRNLSDTETTRTERTERGKV